MLLTITIIGSLGFMLAVMSFITGLQILRGNTETSKKMHRLNGFLAFAVFFILMVLIFFGKGHVTSLLFGALIAGSVLSFAKIRVVKSKRAYKYSSQIGFLLLVMWVIVLTQIIRHLA